MRQIIGLESLKSLKNSKSLNRRWVAAALVMAAAMSARIGMIVGHSQGQLPAPTEDHVGFPEGYKDTYQLFFVFDNYQNRQIRAVYGNPTAASVEPNQLRPFKYPYGSILLFESYTVKEDDNGEPLLDENGRFIPNELTTLFVMRKERGFGADYQYLRNGEWEYVAYRPDGTYATPPSGTGSCALCHLTGGNLPFSPYSDDSPRVGAEWDYVFRTDMYFGHASGAVPKWNLQNYVFAPSTLHAQPGETITVYNSDQLLHHIVADDGSLDTGVMVPGSTFTVQAGDPGTTISFHCLIHSRVKGKIVVDPAQ
jgi:plastocyanin